MLNHSLSRHPQVIKLTSSTVTKQVYSGIERECEKEKRGMWNTEEEWLERYWALVMSHSPNAGSFIFGRGVLIHAAAVIQ